MGNTANSWQRQGIQHPQLLLNPEYLILSHREIRLAFSFGKDLFFLLIKKYNLEIMVFWDLSLKQSG